MAFTGIMTTEAEINQKTGANVSLAYTDTMKTQAVLFAENRINVITGVNYSDSFGALNVDVKSFLSDAVSSWVAMQAIQYDMSGYTSRAEAQTMLDVHYTIWNDAVRLLKEKKATDFITGA